MRVEKARTAYEHWWIYLANGRSCPAEKSCSVKQIGKCSKKKSIRKRGKTIINRRRKPTWKNPIRRKAAEGNEARFTPGQKKGRILLTRCLTEALKRWRTRWFLCFSLVASADKNDRLRLGNRKGLLAEYEGSPAMSRLFCRFIVPREKVRAWASSGMVYAARHIPREK